MEVLLLADKSGFRKGCSYIDNAFTLNQIIEKRREFNMEMHIGFIDLEKAFDRVNKGKLLKILNKSSYPKHLINILEIIYIYIYWG
jgi:hypothetical protein